MTNFGLICPGSTGHLNTMLPLGQELKRRGHRVTIIGRPNVEAKTLAAGLEFLLYGTEEYPQEKIAESLNHLSKLSGLAALRYTINLNVEAKTLAAGLEFLLYGTEEYPQEKIAESLNHLSKLSGLAALRYTINLFVEGTREFSFVMKTPNSVNYRVVAKDFLFHVCLNTSTLVKGREIVECFFKFRLIHANLLTLYPCMAV
ncbi:hypothetical protein AFK68_19475 [Hydrocoleum sp. CS-953]|nr:hypothetical protein AFK68_19475 [Hydrocoleum sp. CS-953]